MSGRKHNGLIWLWLSFFVLLADQWTKHLAMKHLSFLHPKAILPFFNLTLVFNRGVVFSFFSSGTDWIRWVLVLIAGIIALVVLIILSRTSPKRYWLAIGLSLIFGGALGNLWDRVMLSYVVDFLDFYVKIWHWPVFNISDMAVCIGVICVFIEYLFLQRK